MNIAYDALLEMFQQTANNPLQDALKARAKAAGQDENDTAPQVEALVGLLDGLGLSVERTFLLSAAPARVVVAEVTSIAPLAGSERLQKARLSTGARELEVVTGAPNIQVGMRTALALAGAELPAVGLRVEEREVAGALSAGMVCSAKELGLYDYAAGIMAFADDAPLGSSLEALWPESYVVELELTPNRADAFSLLGVARDVAAKLNIPFNHPLENVNVGDEGVDDGLSAEIEDPQGCSRFVLRRVDGLAVKPSPLWLQRRLAALGLRPRNNLVDVTNYTTFLLGQPSHAYDVAALAEGTLVVRRAAAGEGLKALNEESLEFTADDLLITSKEGTKTVPVGVAGIIGGLHHSVSANTRSVALEAAHFDPVAVRKSAKRLGLATDAHTRFERGVDPDLPLKAAGYIAQLLAAVGGGQVHPGVTSVGAVGAAGADAVRQSIAFRPSRVEFLTTLKVDKAQQISYLEGLGCEIAQEAEDLLRVTPPSWRFDLEQEADIVEEVARLYGYDKIGVSVPKMSFVPEGKDTTHRALRNLLVGFGFQETMSYTFSSDAELARCAAPKAVSRLAHPPSQERSVLRTALYPGLLGSSAVNKGRSLALFEIGHVFLEAEEEHLALLLQGDWVSSNWQPGSSSSFYLLKGQLEKLAATMGVSVRLEPKAFPMLHPGVSAAVYWQDREVGFAGRLHPQLAASLDLPETHLAELKLPLSGAEVSFREFSRQPYAERDLAVIAGREVDYASLAAEVRQEGGEKLVTVEPFDVYEGKPIPEGKRSVALRLRFRDEARALLDAEVDGYMQKIMQRLLKSGYLIRDQ